MKTLFTITLPIPEHILSPNTTAHWARKAKAKKAARQIAHLITLSVDRSDRVKALNHKNLHIKCHWFHKTKARRDSDNLQSGCKAYFDGIADALGVNDRIFVHWPAELDHDKLNPRVEISIMVDE